MDDDEASKARAKSVKEAVRSGSIENASRATLTEYSLWLAQRGANDYFDSSAEYEQTCELVRLHVFRAFMEGMEKRNSRVQRWVIILAVVSLISSIAQIWYAHRADIRTQAAGAAANASSQIAEPPPPVPATPSVASPAK